MDRNESLENSTTVSVTVIISSYLDNGLGSFEWVRHLKLLSNAKWSWDLKQSAGKKAGKQGSGFCCMIYYDPLSDCPSSSRPRDLLQLHPPNNNSIDNLSARTHNSTRLISSAFSAFPYELCSQSSVSWINSNFWKYNHWTRSRKARSVVSSSRYVWVWPSIKPLLKTALRSGEWKQTTSLSTKNFVGSSPSR